jgi:hypothetical protein
VIFIIELGGKSSMPRCKLHSPDQAYLLPPGVRQLERRKAVVEPVFEVLKRQREMRQFRTRGLEKVSGEFTLATLACNITRLPVLINACSATETAKKPDAYQHNNADPTGPTALLRRH